MLIANCTKELKPNSWEQHYKIEVGDADANLFAECYIESSATVENVVTGINSCLVAVQEKLEADKEAV